MDKRGALYLRLVTAVFALTLAVYAACAVFADGPAYELHCAQACEVGDGFTVSGFVVRSEHCLTSAQAVRCALYEGQRVSGGQAIAETDGGTLLSAHSGYFSCVTDGYEAVLTPEFVTSASAEELMTAEPQICDTAYGRLISGQTWYFAAPMPNRNLRVGQTVTLCVGELRCTAEVLRAQDVLLLSCTQNLQEMTDLRRQEARIILRSLRGLRVPNEAIYHEDGQTFVYVLEGKRARRREIEILFCEEESVLAGGELREGAQVIVTNTELTDGMVLE